MVQLFWNTVWLFLKMLNIELPYGLEIQLLGINLRKMKTYFQKNLYMNIYSNIIHNNQKVKTIQMSTSL